MIFSLRSPDWIVTSNLGSLSLTYDVRIFKRPRFRHPFCSSLKCGSESRGPRGERLLRLYLWKTEKRLQNFLFKPFIDQPPSQGSLLREPWKCGFLLTIILLKTDHSIDRMIFSLRSPDCIVMANLDSLSLTYDVRIFRRSRFRLPFCSSLECGSESRGPLKCGHILGSIVARSSPTSTTSCI